MTFPFTQRMFFYFFTYGRKNIIINKYSHTLSQPPNIEQVSKTCFLIK